MKTFNYANLYSRGNADHSIIGYKGFFGWDIESLKEDVERGIGIFYGTLLSLEFDRENIFNNGKNLFTYFYKIDDLCINDMRLPMIKKKSKQNYRPYNFFEAIDLIGKIFKTNDGTRVCYVNDIRVSQNTVYINGFEINDFFNHCSWMDDSPCGQLLEL